MSTSETFWTALHAGDLDRVSAHLERNPALATTPSPQGVSPLLTALYYRQPAIADLLRDHVPELDVFEASALGDVGRLDRILDENPNAVAAFAPDGFFPLGLAAFFGRDEAVRLLLERGASPGAVADNAMRITALHAGAASGNTALVAALLRAGADPNAAQQGGVTALHAAAHQGNLAMVRALLDAGADSLAITDDGKTALSFAREDGHAAVEALLSSPFREGSRRPGHPHTEADPDSVDR